MSLLLLINQKAKILFCNFTNILKNYMTVASPASLVWATVTGESGPSPWVLTACTTTSYLVCCCSRRTRNWNRVTSHS